MEPRTCARECSPRPLTTASLRAASSGEGASASSADRARSSHAAMDTTATPTVRLCRSSFSVPFLQLSAAAGRLPFLCVKPGAEKDSERDAAKGFSAGSPFCGFPSQGC